MSLDYKTFVLEYFQKNMVKKYQLAVTQKMVLMKGKERKGGGDTRVVRTIASGNLMIR